MRLQQIHRHSKNQKSQIISNPAFVFFKIFSNPNNFYGFDGVGVVGDCRLAARSRWLALNQARSLSG
jgi:hypothetical protein